MIYDARDLPGRGSLRTDLCVVGAGAGGLMVATIAAEAGLRVVLLEAGPFLTPGDMSQREEEMFPKLLWDAGGRTTRDRGVHLHQGRGVGGSTLHNLSLCKRIPDVLVASWNLEHLDTARLASLYDRVEPWLEVSEVPRGQWNAHNLMLERACAELGWRGGGLRHNRTGCVGSGFCEIGCAFDAKNHAAKVLLPRAIRAGGQVLTHCQALHVRVEDGRVRGVRAAAVDGPASRTLGEIEIHADRVCVSASATATPALLLRSNIEGPPGSTGDSLRIHPAVVAAGDFDEPLFAWRGIPQTYECTQHLDFTSGGRDRLWIVPAFAHPVGTATLVPGLGAEHREVMLRYAHLGVLTAMLHDHTAGRVRPRGELGLSVEYWPEADDREALRRGLAACARLLFAAGARRVLLPTTPARWIDEAAQAIDVPIERGAMELSAVHPMASVPMGDDPHRFAVDSRGKHHHVQGLWVADGSLFPTSIGVPPQLSIYALGLHVGEAIVAAG